MAATTIRPTSPASRPAPRAVRATNGAGGSAPTPPLAVVPAFSVSLDFGLPPELEATEPPEMPSADRPVTADVLASLVACGIGVTPLVLHTGVASLECGEMPYPERYRVPIETAGRVSAAHRSGRRVVAVGTTVVRALETVTDTDGITHPGEGWTDLVITPSRGVRSVDGLLTGWHEPEASHLQMLEAVAGRGPLERAYPEAVQAGYRWHEFGDSHLLLPPPAVAR